MMPTSQRGVAVAEGLRRSAKTRTCPQCDRQAALVHRDLEGIRFADGTVVITVSEVVCRWVDLGLCTWRERVVRD